jgi:hypothetical protein
MRKLPRLSESKHVRFTLVPSLVLVLAGLLGMSPCSHANEYRIDLLNHRITVALETKPNIEPRSASIMGAPEPNETETRVVCEDGDKKMVVMAWELFKRAGDDYSAEARKYIGGWFESQKTEMEPWAMEPNAIGGLATKPDASAEAILYGACLYRHKDGTVQLVGVFFNKKLNEDPEACVKTSRAILASIQSDQRTLLLGETQRFNLSQDSALVVTLPPEWSCATQRGIDFDVHRLYEVKELGKPARQCGIYYGGFPSLHHESMKIEPKLVQQKKGSLLGTPLEWFIYPSGDTEPGVSCECIVSVPKKSGGGLLHFFGSAPDAQGTDGIIDMLNTVRIEVPRQKRQSPQK